MITNKFKTFVYSRLKNIQNEELENKSKFNNTKNNLCQSALICG
jgi:hypothetical protein